MSKVPWSRVRGGAVCDHDGELRTLLTRQRQAFLEQGPPELAVRLHRIDRLLALILDNTDAFVEAMGEDFGTRSRYASLFTEVVGMIPVIEHTRSHVAQWMKTHHADAGGPAGWV